MEEGGQRRQRLEEEVEAECRPKVLMVGQKGRRLGGGLRKDQCLPCYSRLHQMDGVV